MTYNKDEKINIIPNEANGGLFVLGLPSLHTPNSSCPNSLDMCCVKLLQNSIKINVRAMIKTYVFFSPPCSKVCTIESKLECCITNHD